MSEITPLPTPVGDTPATPPRGAFRKSFSLSSAARELGIGKGTVRAAIERGELSATNNEKGHYVIPGASLWQYQINKEADQARSASTSADTGSDTGAVTPVSGGDDGGVVDGVGMGVGTPAGTGVDESNPSVQNLLLKQKNEALTQRNRDLEGERDDWKDQAKKLQEQAGQATRLLTDERERFQQEDTVVKPSSNGALGWGIAAFLFVALVAFIYIEMPGKFQEIQSWLSSGFQPKN